MNVSPTEITPLYGITVIVHTYVHTILVFCTYIFCSFQATQAKAWICFDGPLSGNWVDILDGLISKEKVLYV